MSTTVCPCLSCPGELGGVKSPSPPEHDESIRILGDLFFVGEELEPFDCSGGTAEERQKSGGRAAEERRKSGGRAAEERRKSGRRAVEDRWRTGGGPVRDR